MDREDRSLSKAAVFFDAPAIYPKAIVIEYMPAVSAHRQCALYRGIRA
jgi:hypothetical protein